MAKREKNNCFIRCRAVWACTSAFSCYVITDIDNVNKESDDVSVNFKDTSSGSNVQNEKIQCNYQEEINDKESPNSLLILMLL